MKFLLTTGAPFVRQSLNLAAFISCLCFTCHVFLVFPICLTVASFTLSLSHAGGFETAFPICVRRFTWASNARFLSLLGAFRLLPFVLLFRWLQGWGFFWQLLPHFYVVCFLKIQHLFALFALLSAVTPCSLIMLWLTSESTSPTNSSQIRSFWRLNSELCFSLWLPGPVILEISCIQKFYLYISPWWGTDPVCTWVVEPSQYVS